ncbi:Uncharacterized protein BP5553_07172 [Venustampulla echinocandica]|uniref:Spo12-like protein n=1 Tax=Venustampulla echinocandica TaxID=2656787 RepID=A0A370TIQ7_9HELO|nr:Uncharacterized protein BP5553_07172 [Venustampulla echinocandica]RDL35241.1 Uncharacterized protein BP5553_07172 [Venustampulla echinocandica]
MSSNVLADKDINTSAPEAGGAKMDGKADVKSMDYHRQVLQSKLDQGQAKQSYVSPSDNIMSPCTAKLSAYRNKQIGKAVKPKSLFAKTSAKNLASGNPFAPSNVEKKLDGQ